MKRQAVGSILLELCLCSGFGQSPPEAKYGPIQAELLAHLNVRHFAGGEAVFARVTVDWSGKDCILLRGATLEAAVVSAVPRKMGSESKLALAFNKAQCNGADLTPIDLVLAAVAGVPFNYANAPDSQFGMPMSFSNPHANGMLAGMGSAAPGDSYITHLEFTGIRHRFPMRPNLQPGAVVDIKGLKLELGTGPNRSSVLSSKERDVSLDAYTQFLLVPASDAFQPSAASLAASGDAGTAVPPRSMPVPAAAMAAGNFDNLEVCAPPGCALDLPVTANELAGLGATSIAIRPLGYVPRSHKAMYDFDDEETLAWIGPQELLFTFNPHPLIRRGGASRNGAHIRMIRAVLLDAHSRNILRAVDWELTDSRRYLWQLDGNRILVHVGNELRVYRAGMELERRIPLAGPLAFVRIAPNGELMAVATLRERHSPELHSKLRDNAGDEPEEDVDVSILDKDFKTIAGASTTSGLLPPTLLNEGQVKLLAQPKMRYRLAMSTWENKTITLARFDSQCTPELSSVAPDLLFLLSCSVPSGDPEYRVLRADGKLILRGKSGPRELGREAAGNNQNGTFAVKVVEAGRELSPGEVFQSSDLDSEEVRVYRAADGKRLAAVRVKEPIASHSGYALSPDGSQLAVLSGTQIKFFPVPAE